MHQSTTFPQSQNTYRNSATLRIFLNQKSRILAHIERDLTKLFLSDALSNK